MSKTKEIFIEKCDSTQLYARKLLAAGDVNEKIVIVTEEQTEGKGQGANNWISEPEKNLLCSIIYPFKQKADRQSYISRAVSLALCDLVMLFSSEFSVKWPNDILMNRKKIAGILIEHNISGAYIQNSVIGIGLNVNQEVFPKGLNAVSLLHSTGTSFKIKEILHTLLTCIDTRLYLYENRKWEELDNSYHNLLEGYKKECNFLLNDGTEFNAINNGIDEFGRIILDINGKMQHYDLNEVHMIL